MAGFIFGNVGELNARVTVMSFIAVVFFIIVFDAIIGVIEYFLEGSKLYHRILQTIYKELMTMGLLSFSISMILALEDPEVTHSKEGDKWIKGIEFSHILLFFLTFFFVGHAFVLIRKSILSRSFYRTVYQQKVDDLLKEAPTIMNPFRYFMFQLHYLPTSGVKEKMELWLFHELFRDTYWLPRDFNFADYLSGCFDQYIQKMVDRGYITWIILLLLAMLNFARIKLHIGFKTCRNSSDSSSSHRALGGSSSTTTESDSSHGSYDKDMCENNLFRIFLMCGALLIIYALILVYVSRIYRLRMFARVGVTGTSDYVDFLEFLRKDEEKRAESLARGIPLADAEMTTERLKNDIQNVMDEDEDGEEEAEFKALAETVLFLANFFVDLGLLVQLQFKLLWRRIFHGGNMKRGNSVQPVILASTPAPVTSTTVVDPVREKEDENAVTPFSPAPNSEKKGPASAATTGVKLGHLHRNTTRMPSGSSLSPTNSNSNVTQSQLPGIAEKESSTLSATPVQPVPAVTRPPVNRNARRSSIMRTMHQLPGLGGSGENHHVVHTPQQEAVLSFLKTLEIQNRKVDSNSVRGAAGMMRRMNSTEDPAHKNGGNQEAQLVRRPSTHSHHHRRRSSVQAIAPINALSLVERYKLYKAQKNPAFAARLKRQHELSSARTKKEEETVAAEQEFDKQQEKRGIVTWTMFQMCSYLPFVSINSLLVAKKDDKAQDVEGSAPVNTNHTIEDDVRVNEGFDTIFLLEDAIHFNRAVELAILFNCLYMAFWLSNFLTIAESIGGSKDWEVLFELAMMIPIVIVVPCINYICETASLIAAISELNLHVIHQVLIDTEDTENLLHDFRTKIHARIEAIQSHNFDKDEVIKLLFDEIDQDGSGMIDKTEFRLLLRHLKLTYSDDRFKRLFRAINVSGDGDITFDELKKLIDTPIDTSTAPSNLHLHNPSPHKKGNRAHRVTTTAVPTNNRNANGNGSGEHSPVGGVASGPPHGRMTNLDLKKQMTRGNSNNSGGNGDSRFRPLKENSREEEEDDDEEVKNSDDDDDDEYHLNPGSILRQRPSEIAAQQQKQRSVSQVEYSDTDSDGEHESGRKSRSIHNSFTNHNKSNNVNNNNTNNGNDHSNNAATKTSNGDHAGALGQVKSLSSDALSLSSMEDDDTEPNNSVNNHVSK